MIVLPFQEIATIRHFRLVFRWYVIPHLLGFLSMYRVTQTVLPSELSLVWVWLKLSFALDHFSQTLTKRLNSDGRTVWVTLSQKSHKKYRQNLESKWEIMRSEKSWYMKDEDILFCLLISNGQCARKQIYMMANWWLLMTLQFHSTNTIGKFMIH